MINKERLRKKAEKYDIFLNSEQLEKLFLYSELLVDWNNKINLTAITDEEGIEDKHFIDSLIFASCLPPVKSMVDVGSGAGFPGIVAAVYNKDIEICLMEPTGKRINFLNEVINRLGLINCQTVKERAEEAARKQWRESFDVACARAVAAMPALSEYCLPLVKKGGCFIALKANAEEELEKAQGAIKRLGGKYERTEEFLLPAGEKRQLIYINKQEQTPRAYPRNGAAISKKPLA